MNKIILVLAICLIAGDEFDMVATDKIIESQVECDYCLVKKDGLNILSIWIHGIPTQICLDCIVKAFDKVLGKPEAQPKEE